MGDTKYCLCCNEEVPVSTVTRNARIEVTCLYCGFTLSVTKMQESVSPAEKGYALVADDSKFTRKIIQELLKEKKYSENVQSFENGLMLFSAYSKLLDEKKPVDIAIVDLNMPVMDGLTAARMMRSHEEKTGSKPVQIVFFSAKIADDNLKKQMETLGHANYMNKGTDPDPDSLADRVEMFITYLREKDSKMT